MDWIKVFVLTLFVFSDVTMAEIAHGRKSYQKFFGSRVTQVSTDYFRGDISSVGKNKYWKFKRLFDRFANHPELSQSTAALEKALAFYTKHKEGVSVSCGGTTQDPIQGDWIVVTDYTLPMTVPRQFYINLRTGEVRKAYAGHGGGSNSASSTSPVDACPPEHVIRCGPSGTGCAIPISFDDIPESHKTQTGFFLAGGPNNSGKATFNQGQPPSDGQYNSIILHGAVKSTRKAASREVIYHRSSYIPGADAPTMGCGYTWGCPATDPKTFEDIKDELVEGTLFYNHTIQEDLTVNPSC